ncbi:MAG TPA: MerC domain-containing protein [Bryobacteraceae bacterium]|jgi:mercuric ion transport protein|nr:MerC domain-containing protein [Bryobacteraceae bacterium]
MSWKEHLDKLGIAGSFVAAACCMGLPAIVSILAALGLGFLINDAILRPLMIAFLAVTFIGLLFGFRVHRRLWPLVIAAGSGVIAYLFTFVRHTAALAYLGIAGLIVASVLNVLMRRRCAPACKP